MNGEEKVTDLINGVKPVYYESIVTPRSWWKTMDGRVFFLAYVYHDKWDSEGISKPSTVGLFELYKEKPIEREWRYFVDLYVSGEMIKTSSL